MATRESNILIRVSGKEKKILESKAKKSGMSVSRFIRASLIYSDDAKIKMIDVKPIHDFIFELSKQGTNLNQLMKFLHTYGIQKFHWRDVQEIIQTQRALLDEGRKVFITLQQELEKNHIHHTDTEEHDHDNH